MIGIYLRVSSKPQSAGDRVSLADQEATCRNHPAARDQHITVYQDVLSGKRFTNRPGFQQLMADIKAGKVRIVLAYNVKRLGRNAVESMQLADEIEKLGAKVFSATEGFDRSTNSGWLSFGVLALMADYDNRERAAITKSSLRYLASHGRYVGATPYGYTRIEKQLVPSADAPVVRIIFEWYATNGYSVMDIVDALNGAGYTVESPSYPQRGRYPFGMSTVRHILDNPVYAGLVRFGDQLFPGTHEALIDEALWNTAQALRTNRRSGRRVVRGHESGLLSGIGRCAECGASLHQNAAGGKIESRAYVCYRRARLHQCDAPHSHQRRTDAQLRELLGQLVLPADWRDQVLAYVRPAPTVSPDLAALERELRQLKQRFLDDAISARDYETQRAALKAQYAPATPPVAVDLERAAGLLEDMPALVAQTTADELRAMLGLLFEAIYPKPDYIHAWTPRAAFLPLLQSCGGAPSQ